MNGSEHYKLGETLLANAWKRSAADDTVYINTPERRIELIATAQAHFAAAEAAATALPTVMKMMGDCTEVTAWARAIGADDQGTQKPPTDAAYMSPNCELENHDECIGEDVGCQCLCHRPVSGEAPF